MESTLAESTTLSQKSEREYITLRDSIKSMTESWKHDTDRLRDEMRKREDKLKKEAESAGKKYKQLVDEVKAAQEQQIIVKDLQQESSQVGQKIEEEFREEIRMLKAQVEIQSQQSEDAAGTARLGQLVPPSPFSINGYFLGCWRVSWLAFADLCRLEVNPLPRPTMILGTEMLRHNLFFPYSALLMPPAIFRSSALILYLIHYNLLSLLVVYTRDIYVRWMHFLLGPCEITCGRNSLQLSVRLCRGKSRPFPV